MILANEEGVRSNGWESVLS